MASKMPNTIPTPTLSERISIFEPNHRFYERRFAGPTPKRGPVSLPNQDLGKSKNFNEIKSQFDSGTPSLKNSVGFQGSFWNKLPSVRKNVVSVPVSNEITNPTPKLLLNNKCIVSRDKLILSNNQNNTSDNNKFKSKKENQGNGDKPILRTISVDSNPQNDVIFTKTSDLQMGNMVKPKIYITDESRTSYWSQQALQNENMQKITEALKLDVSSREKKITTLTKELDSLSSVWSNDDDVLTLKRQKHELELRLKVEEDEIDDLASQIELLEHSKSKMEMTLVGLKKEHRREMALKDEELEDSRMTLQKKVKTLELQLETEREERINHVREKHELEAKLLNLRDYAVRSNDGEKLKKTKSDLRRTKALLNDAELMVEKSKLNSSSQVIVKQLKNQLEDAEFSKIAVVKSKQNVELELSDVQSQLEDIMRAKSELEEKMLRSNREKVALRTQLEDKDEELQETIKKFRAAVAQMSVHQIIIQEQLNRIEEHEIEKNKLKEHVSELMIRLESLEGETIMNIHQSRLKLKIQELESKLELEKATRDRMDSQISRLKDSVERLNEECFVLRSKEFSNQELASKLQEQLKQAKEDYATILKKETETNLRCYGLEKQLELAEAETVLAKNDLKLSLRRIEDIHLAIKEEAESDSDTDSSFSSESETSDDETSKFSSVQFNKTHPDLDNRHGFILGESSA